MSKSRERADSFPGFDIAHSRHAPAPPASYRCPPSSHSARIHPRFSNFCDDDEQSLEESAEDAAAAPEGEGEGEGSSDSEHEHAQFRTPSHDALAKLTARQHFCRSAVLLLHSRTAVRLLHRKVVLMSQLM
jgi:hypothetical protein